MSAKVLAIMLLLYVLAASQPALILDGLVYGNVALVKCFWKP